MSQKDYSSFQQGLRRFKKAMTGIPDRVPVCAQLHEFALKELGVTTREFYTNAELLATGTLEILVPWILRLIKEFLGAVFLATATPEAVAQRVRSYIETGGNNGRFVLYLCNLGATTPADNVRAAIAAVRNYGSYSDGSLSIELKV